MTVVHKAEAATFHKVDKLITDMWTQNIRKDGFNKSSLIKSDHVKIRKLFCFFFLPKMSLQQEEKDKKKRNMRGHPAIV